MRLKLLLCLLALVVLALATNVYLARCSSQDAYDGEVRMAMSSQSELLASGERLSADPDKMSDIGVYEGMQVRITNKGNNNYALYTFHEEKQENPETILRIAKIGRKRLGQTSTPITVEVSNMIVHPTMTEAQAEINGEFIERLSETSISHTGLIVLAPHGGMIEYRTDDQAERVYDTLSSQSKDVSAWRAKGWKTGGGAYSTWHITSNEIDPRSFPELYKIYQRDFSYGVAFHGWSEDYIAIAGLANRTLKDEIKVAIERELEGTPCSSVSVEVDLTLGISEENIVNWICNNNGVQIEQPYTVRDKCWREVADAVSSVFNNTLEDDCEDSASGYLRTNEYCDSEAARTASCTR